MSFEEVFDCQFSIAKVIKSPREFAAFFEYQT